MVASAEVVPTPQTALIDNKECASKITVRDATYEDWRIVVDLAVVSEGWDSSYDDFLVWKSGFGERRAKFLVAQEADGDVVGFVCHAQYEPDITVFGMYYIRPDYRSKNIGSKLFWKLCKDLSPSGNMGGNAVVNMADKYASRYGTNHRSEWTVKMLTITGANPAGLTDMAKNVNVIDASQVDLAKLAKFDRAVCKEADRQEWLAAWINHPAGWSRVTTDKNNEITGYGTARIVQQDRLVIGPLYCRDRASAAALVKNLLEEDEELASREIRFYSPSTNCDFSDILEQLGGNIESPFHLVSQYSTKVPDVDISMVYAIADPDLSFV